MQAQVQLILQSVMCLCVCVCVCVCVHDPSSASLWLHSSNPSDFCLSCGYKRSMELTSEVKSHLCSQSLFVAGYLITPRMYSLLKTKPVSNCGGSFLPYNSNPSGWNIDTPLVHTLITKK